MAKLFNDEVRTSNGHYPVSSSQNSCRVCQKNTKRGCELRYGWNCAICALLWLHASSIDVVNGQTVCKEVMDLAFVVDGSGSICDTDPNFNFSRDTTCQNWNFIVQFIGRTCELLNVGQNATRVAMVLFSSSARLVWDLGAYSDKASLQSAISSLTYQKGGTTDTTGGLNVVNSQVFKTASDRPDAPNTVIIITDGRPTNPSTVQPAIDAVHANGIRTLVVGVTDQVDEPTLKRLSSPPQQLGVTYFMATGFQTIDEVRLQLVNQTCAQEPLPSTTSTASPPQPSTTSATTSPSSAPTSAPTVSISSGQPSGVCSSIWDLCFVVDGSGSICDADPNFNFTRDETCNNWNFVLQFIHRLLDGLNIGSSEFRVGLVLFDSTARVLWNLTAYPTKDSLLSAVDSIQYRKGGRTDTTGGLNVMRNQVFGGYGDRPDIGNMAIVITDGKPTDPTTVPAAIDAVHNSGITTLAVGVTDQVDEATLKQLSSPPQQLGVTYFMASDFQNIDEVRLQLANRTCGAVQTITSTISTTTASQTISTALTSSTASAVVSTASTTAATPAPSTTISTMSLPSSPSTTPPIGCASLYDLCFVVDASGSICDADPNFNFTRDETCNNWNFILQFVHRIADGLNIGLSQFRVGMVIFDTTSRVEWNLTAYTTKDALLNAIDHIPYHKGGRTDTTGGLNMMRNQVFGVDGDRPTVSNVAIIITDGKPTDPTTVPAAIDAVHNSGCTTLVVGVTDQVDEPTLKQLSSPPSQLGKTYFIATDFQSIDGVRLQLENQTCLAVGTGSITPSTNAITSAGSSTPSTNAVSSMSPVTSPTSRQPIVCESLWDLCFVVDASGSICDADPNFNFTRDETCNNWNFILQFVHRIADGLNIGLSQFRVGMVIFDTTSRVEWNLTAYTTKDALLNAIDHIPYHKGGRTDTTGGLNMMRNQVFGVDGDRPTVSNVAIIITDGKPTDPTTVPAVIDAVHNSGITTLVVGVTDQVDEPTLKQLSSPPSQLGKTYFIATDFQSIDGVRLQLENQTCLAVGTGSITPSTNAITSAGSSTPSTNAVSSLSPVTSPTSRQPIVCESLWDLCFVVDASGSICDADPNFNFTRDETCNNWNFILQFVHRIADGLNIGLSQFRVGMVIFDTTSRVEWNLTAYTTKDALLNAIDHIPYHKGGRTDTIGGLNMMRNQVFGVDGDRPTVSNVAIIITDGKPTDPTTVPAVIDAVHNSGITTLVVGVTDQVDEPTLKQLSSPPSQLGKTYFIATDFQSIDGVRLQLENQTCLAVGTGSITPSTNAITSAGSSTPSTNAVSSLSPVTSPISRQPIVCESVWDLCFVVDASGSICDADPNFNFTRDETCSNWNFVLQFIHGTVDGLNIGLSQFRVAMVVFDTTSRLIWNLTAYPTKDSLLNAIDHIPYRKGGRTDTTGGLNVMRQQVYGVDGDRSNVGNLAIIITDGKPTDPTTVPAAIDAVHNSGIKTLVVGVTDQVDEGTLKQLSSPPSQLGVTYFVAKDFQTIENVRQQLENQTCGATQTFISTLSTASVTVSSTSSITTPTASVTSTSQQPFVCKSLLDICFVLDASGSICDTDPNFVYPRDDTCTNWNLILQFMHRMVDDLSIGLTESLVGMVLFDSTARVGWNLTAYTTKDSLLNAIDHIEYHKGGRTDTTGGLNVMRQQVYGVDGNRRSVSDVAIIITDGRPTDPTTVPAAIDAVHNSGITTLVVGVTDQVDTATLKQLSSPPQQLNVTYFTATGFDTLDAIRTILQRQTCDAAP